jgi:adenosine kinase
VDGVRAIEPTGVGDAFRAGFLASIEVGLDLERAAQVGCAIAASVVETTGTQEYTLDRDAFLARIAASYGAPTAADVSPHFRFLQD